MEFRVLGPLEVRDQRGEQLPVSAPMLRALLATLVLRTGHVVTVEDLAHQLWGEEPPASIRTAIRNYVMRLRKALREERINTSAGGYQLLASREETDLGQFQALHSHSREIASTDPAAAAELLDEALALWRGKPLTGIGDCPLRTVHQPRLEELRLTTAEERFDLRLALGEHEVLVEELLAAVREHPLRERLTRQLMLALHRSGRSAEALGVFREARRALVDELAIEPGPELRELEQAILRGDAALEAPRRTRTEAVAPAARDAQQPVRAPEPEPHEPAESAAVPTEFPAAPATFVARGLEIARLREWLTGAVAAPAVCLIDGPGGVGKSTLALRSAHESADRFPDGMVHVDLRGADPQSPPLGTDDAVRQLLRALGEPPDSVPPDSTAALEHYQRLVRQRQLLVLLDNAHSSEQVRPLLPSRAGSACLVTSRTVLTGLPGARHLHLDTLQPADAVALVRTVSGAADPASEAEWHELVGLCGRLPLALHVIAVRMASRPRWSVADWTETLRDERRRLTELVVADRDVRASLLVSIEQLRASGDPLDRGAAELFPLLGVAAISRHTTQTAAALTGAETGAVEGALERLTDAQLADSPRPGQYAFHDLVRATAAGEAETLPRTRVGEALTGLARWYLGTLHRVNEPFAGNEINTELSREALAHYTTGRSFTAVDEAVAWADTACDDVVRFAAQLADSAALGPEETPLHGRTLDDFALQALTALDTFFARQARWRAQSTLAETALRVAERRGDRYGQAEALSRLGKVTGQRGEPVAATPLLERSIALFSELGMGRQMAVARSNLVPCLATQGLLREAIEVGESALRTVEVHGPGPLVMSIRNNLGRCYLHLGDHEQAYELLLHNYRGTTSPAYRANTAHSLGEYHMFREEFAEAAEWARTSLSGGEHLDPLSRAEAYALLAAALRGMGRTEEAGAADADARELLDRLNAREAAQLRLKLGRGEVPSEPAGRG
ncbi:AfsR/SARP family transcriptional regulator [Streptomyces sulphureus]|uniref:AfsR/SARP family transcriptional regulator n=1 Tax=Streptomyces sulphureus TaxID=47758 RepID=UPI00035DE1B2|nr:AfsR/SARP family transcriptional regulator [Streptomyces sulphureus]